MVTTILYSTDSARRPHERRRVPFASQVDALRERSLQFRHASAVTPFARGSSGLSVRADNVRVHFLAGQ